MGGMEFSMGSDDPAILQLHKWGSSEDKLDLSEFHEAFLSPTRQTLLLLSHQHEALLLPLTTGDLHGSDSKSSRDRCSDHSSGLSTDCFQDLMRSSGSGLVNDLPCTSGSDIQVDSFHAETECSRSGSYPFISDVNSLAWGLCGESYDQHGDASFRELLFVSGRCGVTVHAFRKLSKSRGMDHAALEGHFGKGRWYDWGPQNMKVDKSCCLHHEFSAAQDVDGTGGDGEMHHNHCEVVGDAYGSSPTKKWLKSFFIGVETIACDGTAWTKFPESAECPSSAEVISFNIFNVNQPCDFCYKEKHAQNTENSLEDDSDHQRLHLCGADTASEVLSSLFGVEINRCYKCLKVFSSASYNLVGFIFTSTDLMSANTGGVDKREKKSLLLVARLDNRGIKWVSLVKPDERVNIELTIEWVDFQFSDNLLVCLNSSGFIVLYDAISGEFVTHLDVAQACGLDPHSDLRGLERLPLTSDVEVNQVYDKAKLSDPNSVPSRRSYKRLVVASHTSVLAVVDENGVIYVICLGDYMPKKNSLYEKLLPYYQQFGLGILFNWGVCGSDISHQMRNSNFSSFFRDNNSVGNVPQNIDDSTFQGTGDFNDSYSSGFSAASRVSDDRKHCTSGMESHIMRKIFLPNFRSSDDYSICFSPLGITCLSKKHNVNNKKSSELVHFNLLVKSAMYDDNYLNSGCNVYPLNGKEEIVIGEALGCAFQGSFYIVREDGLSVYLPSLSLTSNIFPVEYNGYHQSNKNTWISRPVKGNVEMKEPVVRCSPWKIEILDRVLLYESTEEADRLCLENGWDLKIARIRQLQIALDHLKFDEIERSLEMLVDVNIADEGIVRLLFAAVHLMLKKSGNDSEISAASRLLALASCFATKMLRKYGLLQHKRDSFMMEGFNQTGLLSLPPIEPDNLHNDVDFAQKLREMAHFLEIIRNLQCKLKSKFQRAYQGLVDSGDKSPLMSANMLQEDSPLLFLPSGSVTLDLLNQHENSFPLPASGSDDAENLALMPVDFKSRTEKFSEAPPFVPSQGITEKKILPVENPKDMMARWKIDNLDLKTVVKDALLSGRLPLAVLQLHLHRSEDLATDKDPYDTFTEVREIGRAIAYDLFMKGEIQLAVATLQRLGENIESCLKQLLFGTVSRSLRAQVAEEMKRYGYLGPYEWKVLEEMSLIESLYPSSSFWKTYHCRLNETSLPSISVLPVENRLLLYDNFIIECGEIDGIVLDSWINMSETSSALEVDEDGAHVGYWSAAAVWFDAWDKKTVDRMILGQSSSSDFSLLWESELEYHACRNNWKEVSRLLDLIPASVLSAGSLQLNLDALHPTSTLGFNMNPSNYGNFLCSLEELDSVCMEVSDVQIYKFSPNMCSVWLRMFMQEKLAKRFIFLKEYWEGTMEIVSLLARSGFISGRDERRTLEDDCLETSSDKGGTLQALHKVIVHHCAQYNLPNLLDLYLDRHGLVLDNDSLCSIQESAVDCQWTRWLLLSRVKGHEYEASLANAREIMSHHSVPRSDLSVLELDEIIRTVDDIAEGGGEMAALATLMHAAVPIQSCLNSGGVNRHSNSSSQCSLENLKPTLQRFPTLWRTLLGASLGEDTTSSLVPKAKMALSNYLSWRDQIFFSTGHDTSLLQMLPCWFPKAVRRLMQLYVQGPLGCQSLSGFPPGETVLHRDIDLFIDGDVHTEISAISWEATIQRHIEEELYNSVFEETGLRLEHHLHRGRTLAAFNQILVNRVQQLKSGGGAGASTNRQTNTQSDVQTLLSPLSQSEEDLLLPILPLAVVHFEDAMLVASCAFLLELCGLSASMLHVDVAVLKRISSFYKSSERNDSLRQLSPKGSVFHAISHDDDVTNSLAQALADEYLHNDSLGISNKAGSSSKRPGRALILVLHHLEKASIPRAVDGNSCGSWVLSGNGDGFELRSQQKIASEHWSLVTNFCRMHMLPLSTKYLVILARDNDWIGFLSEAQGGGYSYDAVFQVASKEFSDPRLRLHMLTVLRGMQLKKKASSSCSDTLEKGSETTFPDENMCIPVELFRVLAECENKRNPGEVLLMKAKELCWSILAMIASCFPDVSPLSCLAVWLEITAARETSSIKVNDIASQIADNVGAAVDAANGLPAGDRILTFHYNRRSPKRRRLIAPISINSSASAISDNSSSSKGDKKIDSTGISSEEKKKDENSASTNVPSDSDEGPASLSKMVAVLCEQQLFLPLLRAFEMFLPSCPLLPFIRALQAFSQMRLSEASAHLGSFSLRIKEEPTYLHANVGREGQIGTSWISSTASKAADAVLSTCPSPYEKRCLLQLLAATDFGDGGYASAFYRKCYWKTNLAEPLLCKDDELQLGNETLDDVSLLYALEKNRRWEQARNWARQLEASGGHLKSSMNHVTESQAESMVTEWKEFLWDVPEERSALWAHCHTLFIRYSFPALQAGLFFLKHAEAVEGDVPARELHELLLLSLQWLSGMISLSNPVCPLHLLREIETKVWLLAVESETQMKSEGDFTITTRDTVNKNDTNIIDRTASIIAKMDNHINTMRNRTVENNQISYKNQTFDAGFTGNTKAKRRAKGYLPSRRQPLESADSDDGSSPLSFKNELQLQGENLKVEMSFSKWEERIGAAELEKAVLSLLECGQITAAKQLQYKLSPGQIPSEFRLVDAALKLAAISTPPCNVSMSMLDEEVLSVLQSYNILRDHHNIDPLQILESLVAIFPEGSGRGLCKRILAVIKAANKLGVLFFEAFNKQPIELLQLLSLKAQESFEEATLLVQTHLMPAASIAQILAESFLKGLLAAHRGGYMDSQKDEEGPAPLLWRFSDFFKWAELCPSEPEIGHALMRLVITGQEIPHACEVELLILSHHFYKSSSCLDGVDVLVALAATRIDSYVSEGDFPCLARLITGVGNFHALNFILGILIENGQLDLLLQKFSAAAATNTGTAEAIRGFRMAVLISLKHFNPNDLDSFAMVYNHFDMKHETAALLESRAEQSYDQWIHRYYKYHSGDILDAMRYFIEAAEVYSSIDAGNKTRKACAQASLLSLQIRMPDFQWLYLSETNARRALVEQSQFQEALIIAEAYGLNQPGEWALVLWNQMLKPEVMEEFVAEFVAILPLPPSMLIEVARFYRTEVAARGDQSQFSVWLSGGGLPADWAKYLGRSFRCLLKRTRDLRLRAQLSTVATGFGDVVNACMKEMDKVPDNAAPLVLKKGHGGAYLPLM